MKWINTETSTIRRPEYVGSEPAQRATWWNLLAYCAEQENGGEIQDCADWKCRQWQQTCGVTLEEVKAASELWEWEDGCLILWNYPLEKESEVSKNRDSGSKGGRARAKRQAELKAALEAQSQAALEAVPQAPLEAPPPPVLQRKEREGEGKEREGEGITPPSVASSALSLPPVISSGRKFPDHAPLMARINGLRPEWAKPATWSGSELHPLAGTLTQFYELPADRVGPPPQVPTQPHPEAPRLPHTAPPRPYPRPPHDALPIYHAEGSPVAPGPPGGRQPHPAEPPPAPLPAPRPPHH